MVLIGYLYVRRHPRKLLRAYHYACAAKELGADFMYFTLNDVNYEKRQIHGYILVDGKWKRANRPFPNVMINAYVPKRHHSLRALYELLRLEIPHTTFWVGDKMMINNQLKKGGLFEKYIIPSKKIASVKDVFHFLEQYPKVVIKPLNSRQGKNVYYIEKTTNSYIIEIDNKKRRYDYEQISQIISEKLKEKQYLVQPYINSKTRDGRSFDLRIHLIKNGDNKWVNTTTYARISSSESIISNIHHGGKRVPLETFLQQEFPQDVEELTKELKTFGLELAAHFEKQAHKEFDQLGIDVGIDEQKRFWLYEINGRPGYPPSLFGKVGMEKNLISYAIHLANKKDN
ncbi:YheC/YheD family protein [Cellulosilyticum sp. ST5]|uniref:YheC/YheD family endospore coat-associated protein n=1 Tax=Cellulosilyticum sp. ST5 TaxID=3055805 RepID=UPI003977C0DD